MDDQRFDAWTRRFRGMPIRRRVALEGMASVVLGLLAMRFPLGANARKRRSKRRKRKENLKRNEFGCVDVGKPCQGNDDNCCSGICEGKRPKKGKQDKSRCVAHDVGTCRPDQDKCVDVESSACTTSGGDPGNCFRTTGKASYCSIELQGECFPCRTDRDCQVVCGPSAACLVCSLEDCPETGGTICATTERCSFPR